ncbi:venom allergen 5 [Scaptodrosophila lebanonensis]|uniref:Venom allergen-1 n=1 Tax=Drosophila lebanonensis TaxID=7225 RepID=A0A6J2U2Y1_DROLE|nr:venom allergen 5 [Scaptodrosophila lebanonensis]
MLRLSSKCSIFAAVLLILLQDTRGAENETTPTPTTTTTPSDANTAYCTPSLCELFNGTHIVQMPHIGCGNNGSFAPRCGPKPHLLYMSERRRTLLLDLHNLARARIAGGELPGYKPAAHMPLLRWDAELEHLATLHAKRCQFAHDKCRNTPHYKFSGQNIGYFWIGRDFKSHSRRMKAFVVNWFREYLDANQTFINSYRPHPQGKKIGHFTLLVADRVHRVGCAAVRYLDPQPQRGGNIFQFMLTCNYDYNNIFNEPIYQTGPMASKCPYRVSEKYPALCDWKDAVYDYDSEESAEDGNLLDNNIPI